VKKIDVVARTTDPDTSHEAAAQLELDQTRLARSVQTVVDILAGAPLHDFDIRALWPRYWSGPFSDSLPCKARHWAREQGLVRFAGYGAHHGRKVRLWARGRDHQFLSGRTARKGWNAVAAVLPPELTLVVGKWEFDGSEFQTIQVAYLDLDQWFAWHFGTYSPRLVPPTWWAPINAPTPSGPDLRGPRRT
jgi:hypothetical protein